MYKKEPRYTSYDWDQPLKVKTTLCGGATVRRKVITRDVRYVPLNDGLQKSIEAVLRSGREVRLGNMIRLFPCVDKTLSKMEIVAQTIGDFRNCIADKSFTITYRGEDVDGAKLAAEVRACAARKQHRGETEVTPDSLVECPNCGTRFRVGRRNH